MTVFVIAFILGAAVGGAFVHFTMLAPLKKELAGKQTDDGGRIAAGDFGKRRVAVAEVGELYRNETEQEIVFSAAHTPYESVYGVQVRDRDGDKASEQIWLSGGELMELRRILDARDDWAKPLTGD